jgi:hypothetical protein
MTSRSESSDGKDTKLTYYPSIPPDTLVYGVWPGARPEGRWRWARTLSTRDLFGGETPCYRVQYEDGGTDYIHWQNVEPAQFESSDQEASDFHRKSKAFQAMCEDDSENEPPDFEVDDDFGS